MLRSHVAGVGQADRRARAVLSREVFEEVVAAVPDAWLTTTPGASARELREAYVEFLTARLGSTAWLPEVAR